MDKELKKGFTTGVHALAAFKLALESFGYSLDYAHAVSQKIDNDDLDVTKGCDITVEISSRQEDISINPIGHHPYVIANLRLYAGDGIGVVTKKGLKAPIGYPAINPTPLRHIKEHYLKHPISTQNREFFASISAPNGIERAKQTANAKVGVLGGISILGTTGFVKPVSNSAFLESIETELSVIVANFGDRAVLTLGNSSLKYAKERYDPMEIVEVGNFVYDAISKADQIGIKVITFVCGIGKAVKIAQGNKNTHNKFGSVDFVALKELISDHIGIEVDTQDTKTVKGISKQLSVIGKEEVFIQLIKEQAAKQLRGWFPNLRIKLRVI